MPLLGDTNDVFTDYTYNTLGQVKTITIFPEEGNFAVKEITSYDYYPVNAASGAAHTNGELKSIIVDPGGLDLRKHPVMHALRDLLSGVIPGVY